MCSNSLVLSPPKAFSHPPTHTCMHKEYALKKGNVSDCFFGFFFPPNEQTRAVIRLLPVFSYYYEIKNITKTSIIAKMFMYLTRVKY